MSQDNRKEEWARLAPAWIKEVREGSNANRQGLLDPAVLDAFGDVRGLTILDCGCGEGRFCRILAKAGAQNVLGLDLCDLMVEAANECKLGVDRYQVADVQDLSFLAEATFDLAISYLNQCDLADFQANNTHVFRVLKPGGRFIIANLHPMRSAVGGWHKGADGGKQHVILDQYFNEGPRHWTMMRADFTNFHRTLATYTSAYIDTGFAIERIVEPTVDLQALVRYPELDDELRVPNFILFVLRKSLP